MIQSLVTGYSVRLVALLSVCALLLLSPTLGAQEISVELQVDRAKLSISETMTLNITVKNAGQDVPMPDVSKLGEFDVTSRSSQINFQSYNGVSETSVVFSLALAPKKAGSFNLGPAQAVSGGKTYTSNVLTVVVTDEPTGGALNERMADKRVFLEGTIDNDSPFVGEQVTLSVRFYHSVNLISKNYTPPQTTDFWSEPAASQRSYYTNVNGKRYRVLEITTALFPTRAGELEIGRALMHTEMSTKRGRSQTFGFGSLFERGEAANLRTRPILVNVKPLPTDGKPKNFTGAVGRFALSAHLDKAAGANVEVNTPVSVYFQLQGKGNIKVLAKPEIPELAEFRAYSGASEEQITKEQDVLGGVKVFEEIFIPKRAGQQVIPSVDYNFFDPVEGSYRMSRSKPIVLNVGASTQPQTAEAPFASGVSGRVGSGMTAIRYIKKVSGGFSATGSTLLFDRMYILLNTFPILVIAFAAYYRRRQERMETDQAFARSRGAKRQAQKRLKRAKDVADVATAEEFFAEVRLALLSFVADKLNVSAHGLTIDEFTQRLSQAGFSEDEVGSARNLIQRADFVRYSSGALTQSDIDSSLNYAEELLVKLQEVKIA